MLSIQQNYKSILLGIFAILIIITLTYNYFENNPQQTQIEELNLVDYLNELPLGKSIVSLKILEIIKNRYEPIYANNEHIGPTRENNKVALCFPKTQKWNFQDNWLLHRMGDDRYYSPEGGCVIIFTPDDIYEWLPLQTKSKLYYKIEF